MTNTEAARPARAVIPALVEADAAYQAWKAAEGVPSHDATLAEYDQWTKKRDSLLANIADAEASAKGLICRRCHGTGRLVHYSHRSRGLCYQCNGDGWTTKGRRTTRP